MTKQLSFGEIFSDSVDIYKNKFSFFIKTLIFVYVLPNAALALCVSLVAPKVLIRGMPNSPAENFIYGIILILSIIIFTITNIVLIMIIAHKKTEFKPDELVEYVKKYFLSYLIFSILLMLALVALTLLLIIPMIIFAVYWSMASFFLLLEHKKIIESFKESKKLVEGNWWKVFLYFLLMIMIIIAIAVLIGIPIGMLSFAVYFIPVIGVVISSVLSDILSIILMPFPLIFSYELYLRLKEKKGHKSHH